MNPRMQSTIASAAPARHLRPLLGGLCLLLLGWGSAAPARATGGTIDSTWTGSVPIVVSSGETLTITNGGSVSSQQSAAIVVEGGTVNISGGSVSNESLTLPANSRRAIWVLSGTVNISSGTVSSVADAALRVDGGTVNISGGMVSSPPGIGVDFHSGTVTLTGGSVTGKWGILNAGGTLSISGCLRLSGDTLTGTLADGTAINTFTRGLTAANLQNLSTCDFFAPTTTASASSYTVGTWTNQTVNVVLNATDLGGSGTKEIVYSAIGPQTIDETTVPGAATEVTITADGTTTLSFFARDNAGNVEDPARTFTVNIDKTPPVVTYSGNAGTYTVDQVVTITCSATDTLSGVASHTCQNITGPAFSFNLGANPYLATATDYAGNTGGGSTSFTVQVTPSSLSNLVSQFVTDPAVVKGLQDKLATIAQAKGKTKATAVEAFINQVTAQTGKSLTAAQAEIFIRLVRAL